MTSTSDPAVRDASAVLLERLQEHRTLGSVPVSELEWLIARGEGHVYEPGDVVTHKGELAAHMLVLFTGHVVIRVDRGAGSHKVFEWHGGDVGGNMPYSRGASPPNDAVAEERTETLRLGREHFLELTRECPNATAKLVHAMIDRARQFTSSDLRDEKLVSLGRLAAGLAHELNNPASAVVRSAKALSASLGASEAAARRLGAARLDDEQLAAIDRVRDLCAIPVAPGSTTALAQADREDAIAEWLEEHDANPACAGPLSETGVTLDDLETLASRVTGESLDAALRWLSSGCAVRMLASEVEMAATRIHDLVGVVKGFSYMDRAPTVEPIDVRRGISDTLTLLGSKIRGKRIAITMELPNGLPRAMAVGAELNQVWMNLFDNAIDAAPVGGQVSVRAVRDLDKLAVYITDNGAGIPPEIQGRIFDPFFTTKPVGQGTGLGLDIVRKLLRGFDASIGVESRPGRTEFEVRLPTAP